jgi:hypothetical protein
MKETPKNIIYHTPRPKSPGSLSNESLEQSYKSIEAAEPVSSGRLLLRREEPLTTAKYEGRANSLAVFGTCLAEGSNMDETSKGVQSQANRLINIVDRGSPHVPYEDEQNQCLFELESTGHSPSRGGVCISEMGWASDSFSNVSRRDKQLDSLSADLLTNLSLQVSKIRRGREVSKKLTRIDERFQETPAENLEYRASQRCHPQAGNDTNSVQGSTCSSQSDYSTSRNGTSSTSEHDSQTSVSSGTSRPLPKLRSRKPLLSEQKASLLTQSF